MSRFRVRNVLAAVAIVVGLFATLGTSSASDNPSSNRAPNATGRPGGTGTIPAIEAQAPVPLGTETAVAKGWDLRVDSAELDADAAMAGVDPAHAPPPGKQFVLVEVSVTNNSEEPAAALLNVKLSLLPRSGVAIDSTSCLASAPHKFELLAQMQPGATQTGNLCFAASPTDIPGAILLAEPQFTVDRVKDQRFFAIV